MPVFWQRVWDVVSGGADASLSEMLLRISLISCTLVALIQLFTMWGTRWGERNSLTKSLGLSVLIHFCLGLGWATVVELNPAPVQTMLAEESIVIRQIDFDQSEAETGSQLPSSPVATGSYGAPHRLAQTAMRTAVNRPMEAGELPERMETPAPRATAPATLPSLTTVEDRQAVPESIAADTPSTQAVAPAPTTTPSPEPVVAAESSATQSPRFARGGSSRGSASASSSGGDDVPRETSRPSRPLVAPQLDALPSTGGGGALVADVPQGAIRRIQDNGPRGRVAPAPRAVLRGLVRDARTGRPLASTTVRVDLADGRPILTRTDEDGVYELTLSQMPENVAVSASRRGYLPESKNLRVPQRSMQDQRLDFSLQGQSESVIAIEDNPAVHHLGNDRFEGSANSQFQRVSEGTSFSTRFMISAEQRSEAPAKATVTFLAKGIQCLPRVQLNDHPLKEGLAQSPADGSFGALVLPINPAWLRVGENVITIHAVNCMGSDIDDFEFVNLQVRLSPE